MLTIIAVAFALLFSKSDKYEFCKGNDFKPEQYCSVMKTIYEQKQIDNARK